jgi:DNA-binding NarL/FixJ family response regulator
MPELVRVLVVDSHPTVAERFRQVLDREPGIEVVCIAGTIEAALACAADDVPDVVLVDQTLPDGTGLNATRRLRESLPGVRVVLLVGSGRASALPAALRAGCSGYVEKSTALDHLVPTVVAVAAGGVVIHASELTDLAAPQGPLLTGRERDVLALFAEGLTNREIAERLGVSVHTVRSHVQTVLSKLGVHAKADAVAVARERGLL